MLPRPITGNSDKKENFRLFFFSRYSLNSPGENLRIVSAGKPTKTSTFLTTSANDITSPFHIGDYNTFLEEVQGFTGEFFS